MRPLRSLSLETIIEKLWQVFSKAEESRSLEQVSYSLPGTLMSGFAVFFFQHPSILDFQRRMKHKRGLCNLETIFKVKEIPSETQMREILDSADVEVVRVLFSHFFERVRLAGWANDYKSIISNGLNAGSYYVCAFDGSDYFHSQKISCPSCLRRKDKAGGVHYYHTVLAATIVKAGSHRILPIDAEQIKNEDGSEKQDCEINAGKRLALRVRKEHRQIELIITGDDLYSKVPFLLECKDLRFHYVVVAKPSSHKELFEWVEDLDNLGMSIGGSWHVGAACKRKFYEYRIVKNVPLTQSEEVFVNFVEVWERNKAGVQTYHNSWVTDLDVTAENVSEIVGIGRSKWKVENEHFNIQKNHGYELEHNFGHGKKNLSHIFYLLNLLAFVVHKIIERGDSQYRQCFDDGISRREFWNGLRTLFSKILFESWSSLLEFWLDDELIESG